MSTPPECACIFVDVMETKSRVSEFGVAFAKGY